MVFQVDRNSYRSQTKSLCDLIDLDVPVCAAPSDVDQTRYPNVTSFFPLGWVQHPTVLRHSDRTYKWCMTSVILASADKQLLAVLMGLSHAAALEQSSSAVLTPAALSLRKYHYPRCLSSRIHREQSDGRARTLDTIRRLELVTQSLACEGSSGNVSTEGVFGFQGTGHRCFLCRSYDQVQMKTQDPGIIPHPETLVKRFQEIFLYFFFALIH